MLYTILVVLYNTSTLVTVAIVISIIFLVCAILIGYYANKNKNITLANDKPKRPLTEKQKRWIYEGYDKDYLEQTTFDELSKLVSELFFVELGSEECNRLVTIFATRNWINGKEKFLHKIQVVPDGDKQTTWPLTATKGHLMICPYQLLEMDKTKRIVIYHDNSNYAFKIVNHYLRMKGVEIHKLSKIGKFDKTNNYFCTLDIDSEEMAFVYFMIRKYVRFRTFLGLESPLKIGYNYYPDYKNAAIRKYEISESEFAAAYVRRYMTSDVVLTSIMKTKADRLTKIGMFFSSGQGYKDAVPYYHEIEKNIRTILNISDKEYKK